jgi:hypothetical protein
MIDRLAFDMCLKFGGGHGKTEDISVGARRALPKITTSDD